MNTIVVFDEVMGKLAEFKVANANTVYDCRDPQGNKDCRSHIASLRKFKTRISDVHKEAKKEALKYGRMLDGLKNKYTVEVVEMIDYQKAPLDEIEAEKQARIDEDVRKHTVAEAARLAELEAKEKLLQEIQAQDVAERAEAERIVREKKIAEEAAARATAEAEAKAKLEAEEAVRAIAEAKALHKAQLEMAERAKIKEIQRVKAEAKLKADAKERVRVDAETKAENEAVFKQAREDARIANEEHREKVQGDIEKCLVNMGVGIETTTDILTALIEDRIPHLMIVY
jgi:hypothetical protein